MADSKSRKKTNSKSSSSKKTSTVKKSNTTKRKSNDTGSFPTLEVILFAILAFCVVLFVGNIGKAGVLGDVFSKGFFALFGIMNYAFPVILFILTCFFIANLNTIRDGGSGAGRFFLKFGCCIAMFIFLCAFCYLINTGDIITSPIDSMKYSLENHSGGGILGGAIGAAFLKGIGRVCSYLIIILILVFCVILITEKSLFKGIKNLFSGYGNDKAKASKKRSNEPEANEYFDDDFTEEEYSYIDPIPVKTPRSMKKGRGIPMDTTLRPGGVKESQDVKEIVTVMEEIDDDIDISGIDDILDRVEEEPVKPRSRKKMTLEAAQVEGDVPEVSDEELREFTKQSSLAIKDDSAALAPYTFPDVRLLAKGSGKKGGDTKTHLREMKERLERTLATFGVDARVSEPVCGPSVTRFEVYPAMGVKVSKIVSLTDDIKLNMAVPDIRMEAPIPGKSAIGIEIPNKDKASVSFRDLIESDDFQNSKSKISFCAGKDIEGNTIIADIAKMPHLLVAGSTGSGKSVCINTIVMSILFKARPDEVKLIMIDPKVVELQVYNGIPHLVVPVVTDPKKAAGILNIAVAEMSDRYDKFAKLHVRNIGEFNKKIMTADEEELLEHGITRAKMSQLVIIVDEFADLMMVASKDVETAVCRLAQLARAAGIHLILATQRPSVNVITGLIKANMPSRIAFSVASGIDSRTIIDMNGAEKLLGKGDMLYYPSGLQKPKRVQGAFVSDDEVSSVVEFIKSHNERVEYDASVQEKLERVNDEGSNDGYVSISNDDNSDGRDSYFKDAGLLIIDKQKASISFLQRYFKIGFNRAARIMDQLEEAGLVGPEEGTKPRRVLLTQEEFEELL